MSETNRTYRIKADVANEQSIHLNITQEYDSFDILSLNISQKDLYKLHSADYGVIVGRVVANGNFGVPNAKISVFIEKDPSFNVTSELEYLYPYILSSDKNSDRVRYNLLPDNQVSDCHQVVGTFPNKTYLLANDVLMDVFDKYYRFTCRTNNSGDYVICGVPVGTHALHVDLDLSDCGILSQRPRDFVYKGYTIEQFENPNKFKDGTEYSNLSQVFTQDQVVNVIPFWGNTEEGDQIGITRADVEIAFKFEPTCVFIGSVISDNSSNGISRKCVPTNTMGAMDELVTGEGTIEMIRKTPAGAVEEFQIKGNQLINENGIWCYQIPMNLDFMMTDEYGNMVPTDDPEKGIPTRTRVRFRVSMQDSEKNVDNYFRCKVLVPNRNSLGDDGLGPDYDFGTNTREDSYRDLFWNYVYSVKSYIPRIQKTSSFKTERFTGIKHCNIYSNNNPMPYNNIRIRIPFMFTVLCALIKTYIRIVYFVNTVIAYLYGALGRMHRLFGKLIDLPNWMGGDVEFVSWETLAKFMQNTSFVTIGDGLCPEMEGWYFSPVSEKSFKFATTDDCGNPGIVYGGKEKCGNPTHNGGRIERASVMLNTLDKLAGNNNSYKAMGWYYGERDESKGGKSEYTDETSVDANNSDSEDASVCLTRNVDYLLSCIEMNLAQEYRVINFDFYNDWINGTIYIPRFMRYIKPKKTYLWGAIKTKEKVRGCMSESKIFGSSRKYFQQCSVRYDVSKEKVAIRSDEKGGCSSNPKKMKCHSKDGRNYMNIFGWRGGAVEDKKTFAGHSVFYMKPYDSSLSGLVGLPGKPFYLFATDIILLGSLNDCDDNGVPKLFRYLSSSSYIMPTNLAMTTMNGEGFIYSTYGGSLCTQGGGNRRGIEESGVTIVGQTYWDEYNSTSGTSNELTLEIGDDAIPVTEAAGISWDYEGPDQVDDRAVTRNGKNLFYNPGGHFLGISCTESETTVKSCINLQRICELGTNMSERKELVRGMENDFEYSYIVPNGVIAGDEVVGIDARAMFATLNSGILLANERTTDIGYPMYSFSYLRPGNFDGSIGNKIVGTTRTLFNKQITIEEDTKAFSITQGDRNDDYDSAEASNTYMRLLEYGSNDYLKFRFGGTSRTELVSRFIEKRGGGGYILPQYENSFYFFFGLRNGSTALDEFNKQFYSECESNRIERVPEIRVINANFSYESAGTIEVCVRHMEEGTSGYSFTLTNTETGYETKSDPEWSTEKCYEFTGLGPGRYTVSVTNGVETVDTTVSIGDDFITLDVEAVDAFITPTSSSDTIFVAGVESFCGRTGGYILLGSEVIINGSAYTIDNVTTLLITLLDSQYSLSLTNCVGFVKIPEDENGETKYMLFMNERGLTDGMSIEMEYQPGRAFTVYSHVFTDNSGMNIDFGDGLKFGYGDGEYSGLTFNNWEEANSL